MAGWVKAAGPTAPRIAVENAHPDVIAVADEVTAANDDDGVAIALERLVLDRRTRV